MKILHTADWHIGKKLHSYNLAADFDRFVDWLSGCIQEEAVDVLLVSGDCFDLANPSSAARNQYYESLVKLKKVVPHIILTGGNHDSPAVLDAPKELMKTLNLDVVGGLPHAIEDLLIPLKNEAGEAEVVVAAIPYLRHPDLRKDGQVVRSHEERLAALRDGITAVFQEAAEQCQRLYPKVPALAMGHLYAAGIEPSDSERDIQIGNQAAVQSAAFGDYFSYVALGHIHKPQRVNGTQPIFYSGSPLPLSFSERSDHKRVLLIDTETGWNPRSIPVPTFRQLKKITGDLWTIQSKLHALPVNDGLETLLEIELKERDYQASVLQDLEAFVADFQRSGYTIVKHRARFEHQLKEAGELFDNQLDLSELNPKNVFEERLALENLSVAEKHELDSAFLELLEELSSSID